jgi:hypothetical protein
MAIPRSPPLVSESARTNLQPPDDDEEEIPLIDEDIVTPDTSQGHENPQGGSPHPDNSSQDPANELTRLRQALQEAQRVITVLRRSRTLTPAPEITREPKVNKPAEFDGKLSEYSKFISQCLLTFRMCPVSYAEDEQKVLFVISYLTGTPRGWARPILEDENHALRNDFPAFKKKLDTMYADRNLKQKALDKLGHLAQTKSVATYSAEFQQIIAPLNLDEDSKQSMFYKGLHRDIKKSLIFFPQAKTFDELLEQCISIDQRQYALRQEERFSEKSSKPNPKSPSGDNHKKSSQSPRPNSSPGSTSKPKQPHPPVPGDERNRRRENNLCFRCGSPDHRINGCPLNDGPVPNRPAKASNAQTSNAKAPDYSSPSFPPENWPSQGTLRPVS